MKSSEQRYENLNRRFTVRRGTRGWDVTEELDREVVRHTTYTDWHRVERALQVFQMHATDLNHSTNL